MTVDLPPERPDRTAPAVGAGEHETLCHNEWLSLHVVRKPDVGVNGYVYSHESRCQGRIVAVLPYRDTASGREYLLKSEMTPCWGFDQVLSAITGGYEGGDIEDDAVREMLEETGYTVDRGELIPLGESFASKSADTVYSLFSVDLTGREPGEATGDGTRVEAESSAIWLHGSGLGGLRDPQVAVMYLRLLPDPSLVAEVEALRAELVEVHEVRQRLLAERAGMRANMQLPPFGGFPPVQPNPGRVTL